MHGAIAQLVERLNGIQEATGSNPVSSTRLRPRTTPGAARYGILDDLISTIDEACPA